MNSKQRERLVDSALDRTLGPRLVEPRPGLEDRILASLRAQPEPRRSWRWVWIPALAAVTLLALVIGVRVMHKTPAPVQARKVVETPKQQVAQQPQPAMTHVQPRSLIAKRITPQPLPHAPAVVAASAEPRLPRLDVFPSRGTLTPEEKLLIAFVRQQPSQARTIALQQAARAEEVQKYLDNGQVPPTGPSGITK